MGAPTGSISVCKHWAREENGICTHKTSWFHRIAPSPSLRAQKKSPTSLPLVSLFPLSFMHIRAFVCHQHIHAPSESTFKASLRHYVTGLLRFWVYYCWDVSFLVKTHRCRWIQIWRRPRPGDVFNILFSHSSNTISLVAFYLPFLLLPPYAPQRLPPPVFFFPPCQPAPVAAWEPAC